MGKISTQDLASVLVERWHIGKKEASQFVNELFFLIQKSLDEDKIVKVKGLGTFKIIDVDDRESVDVNTGDRVLIEGHGKITFTPDVLMKELVNKPFSQFETVVLKDGVDFNEAENTVQTEEPAIPDEIEDTSAPLVEFVTEEELPEKPVETKEPEAPVTPLKSEEPASSAPSAPSEPMTEETPSEEKETSNEDESSEHDASSGQDGSSDQDVAAEEEEEVIIEEEESAFKKYWKWIAIAIATLAVGILIGYLMGNRSTVPQTPESPSVEAVDSMAVKSLPAETDSVDVESSDEEEEELEEEDSEEDAPEEAEPQTDKAPEATAEERPLDKWEAMDIRVQTGAYRILGTDTVVKAKAGDNLTRIGNRLLGPGMECYLEVYNGIAPGTTLTAGQEIKIPKVELKKKKKKIE